MEKYFERRQAIARKERNQADRKEVERNEQTDLG
jgi:hypothetical protein